MTARKPHVIIVGGGASGALLAISLLRVPSGVSVTVVEPRPLLARGFAYGEAAPFHLLNVRAANMSAYPDAPDHFLEWLDRSQANNGVTGEGRFRFVPRRTYGRYLAEQLHCLASLPAARLRLQRIHGEAIALDRRNGEVVVPLADGRTLVGDVGVIATGYALKRPSSMPRLLPSWKELHSAALAGVESVLILGTGHSAIDHLQWLLAAGYQGTVTMMSRHGFLPAVHLPVEPVHFDADEVPFSAKTRTIVRWFRQRAAAMRQAGTDWRSVLDGLRPHAQALWQSLATQEQRRFIRHVRAWYDVRRHRLAPSIAATIERLKNEGRLHVIAGRMLSVSEVGGGAIVTYRRRGSRQENALAVQVIIECTGFDLDPRTSDNVFVRNLLAQGLVQAGPHGFGIEVTPACAVIDAQGRAADDLYAVGPLTRGQFWEVVGLPDVRQQCARLAALLGEQVDAAAKAKISA